MQLCSLHVRNSYALKYALKNNDFSMNELIIDYIPTVKQIWAKSIRSISYGP